MQPGNPIVGGTVLRIPGIQSPNFVSGTSGWSINQDGTAEFNGLTLHGTLVLGTGNNNVIILDFARRAVFVYDNTAQLIASVAGEPGTDSFGNAYQVGITSYLSGNVNVWSNLEAGAVQLQRADGSVGFNIQQSVTGFTGLNQPSAVLISPSINANPTAELRLWGQDSAATRKPMLVAYRSDNSDALDFIIQGTTRYGTITSDTPTPETWHALPLAPNWANTGSPWANGSYMRTNDNRVNLGGVIQWNAAASNAPVQVTTALPAAYRPISQHRLIDINMPSSTTTATVEGIDVHTDGTIWITGFPNGTGPMSPITLTGLSYPLDL